MKLGVVFDEQGQRGGPTLSERLAQLELATRRNDAEARLRTVDLDAQFTRLVSEDC